MHYPEVSIIVPIYNAEKYIEKCSRSLFEQTFQSIEYIFVNDCSSDNSINVIKEILNDYPNRKEQCIFIELEKNSGPATARNCGIKKAHGTFIYFCDADDWTDPFIIEKMYSKATERCADICICDFYNIYKEGFKYHESISWTGDKIATMQRYLCNSVPVVWILLVKKRLYTDHKIEFIHGCIYSEDFNLTVKLMDKAQTIVNIPEALYYHNCMNLSSITHEMQEKTMDDERIMDLDLISYFQKEKTIDNYIAQLNWRILNSKKEWLLNVETYDKFKKIIPESNRYILSCPYLNFKLKIMGWCLVHRLGFISLIFLCLRHLKQYFINRKRL